MGNNKNAAINIACHTYTIEEFIAGEIEKGKIEAHSFTANSQKIRIHGHCHQKALSSMTPTKKVLSAVENFDVKMIPSGCCGMAGSFGYEKEHFDVSMKVGELVLFPKFQDDGNIPHLSGLTFSNFYSLLFLYFIFNKD